MRAIIIILLLGASLLHAEEAQWIRYSSISPDGSRIAFSYRGDLWIVLAEGGEARPLTSHVGYESNPVWSRDGKWLAYTSDRHGNTDIFLVPAQGGRGRRLTHHSSYDTPACFSPDGKRIWFTSRRMDDHRATLPSPWLPELYSIAVEGGKARRELTTPALAARISPDGTKLAYTDVKGFENRWRKHHVSSVARDIVVYDFETKKHRRLTPFRGEDRNPAWSSDGKTISYLSEQGGNFNVWSRPSDGSGEPSQVTRHATHPCRFLSISGDNTLCYTFNGELWTARAGAEPKHVRVTITVDERENAAERHVFRGGATQMAPSPEEDEVAFVVRGELFVASVKHGTTKRITDTPGQERSPSWAPDGKTLYYAAERDGSWNLYKASLKRKGESHFATATQLERAPVLVGPDETFQPVVSPDGKSIAYLFNRDELRVLDLESGKSKSVVPAERNYSYRDGDVGFGWSPDSKWIVTTMVPPGRWLDDLAVVNVETGKMTNVTRSGYYEGGPEFSRNGAAIYYVTNRYGRRNHGSWGSDADVLALYLTQEAYDRARLSEEELKLLEETEEEEKEAEEKKKKEEEKKDQENGEKKDGDKTDGDKKEKKKKEEDEKKVEPTKIEFERLEDRRRRITTHSAAMGAFSVSPDGESVVYWASFDGEWHLWLHKIRKGDTKRLAAMGGSSGGDVYFNKKGDAVFVRTGDGGISKVDLSGDVKRVKYAAEMTIDGPAERAYMFEHAWRQTRDKFYNPTLHGVDWPALKANYAAKLPHVSNNNDFAEVLSEMLGELNASHTGGSYRPPQDDADQTAVLGLFFKDDGYEVAEVLKGGPADRADSKIQPGVVLTHIDGTAIDGINPNPLLNRKAGKRVLLAFKAADGTVFEEIVKPIGGRDQNNLLYRRWTRRNRDAVEKISKGRVGYVHIRGMNDSSFRHVFQEVIGRHGNKEALVVDTRFNGGGNLHDDLVKFLGGEQYSIYHPRGKKRGSLGGEPWARWARPVVVVQNEGNYSDAHIFPYAFQKLGIGKLVGAPVPGTGTAVWWERQIDPTITFGIPQVGYVTLDGKYFENNELFPDVEVYNTPEGAAGGQDAQLERAVAEVMKELK